MICPVCKTNNAKQTDCNFCAQCGSDLVIYNLLHKITNGVEVQNEAINLKQTMEKKLSNIFIIFQIISAILLLSYALFGILVGMKFWCFLTTVETKYVTNLAKVEIGFGQLQQMISILEQELKLIINQQQENQQLQAKLAELSKEVAKATNCNVKEEINELSKN